MLRGNILPQSWGKKYLIGLCCKEIFYLRAEGRNIWSVYAVRKYFTSELREEISDRSMLWGNILPQSWGKKYFIGLCHVELFFLGARGTKIWPGGVLRYKSHKGTCRPKGCCFWAFLVWKRVYILPISVFEGTMEGYERIYRFTSKWIRKK